jgi:hypothetical protein
MGGYGGSPPYRWAPRRPEAGSRPDGSGRRPTPRVPDLSALGAIRRKTASPSEAAKWAALCCGKCRAFMGESWGLGNAALGTLLEGLGSFW